VTARALLLLLGLAGAVQAAPKVKLRMATIAPEGTAWARLLKALNHDVAEMTQGDVELKWYMGGITGDELTSYERLQRGQLDGIAGTTLCPRAAPSLRVTRVVGIFQNRDEAKHILARLRPTLDEEFAQNGLVNLVLGNFGSEIIFTREPVRSMADLRRVRLWVWDLDEMWLKIMPHLGLKAVPLPVTEAARAYDDQRIDGFIGIPAAALVFQWSTRAKYFIDLRAAFLPGCLVVAKRAFDAMPTAHQQALRAAMAKLAARFDDSGRAQDEALVGGLFEKQGMIKVPISDLFRSEFFDAARAARDKLDALLPRELVARVQSWLADYRVEHPPTR
jgi:TRAP-type transport system periplasmic protein